MIRFRTFLLESVGKSLPHIHTMTTDQFRRLIEPGELDLSRSTEKTDGMPHQFGYDEQGFYTQTKATKEVKVRSGSEYLPLLQAKASERHPFKEEKVKTFSDIHETLAGNLKLQDYMKERFEKTGQDVKVRGEILYKGLLQPEQEGDRKDERRFVVTPYRVERPHMGDKGMFVVHTQLPENVGHDIERLKQASDLEGFKIDDDKINIAKTTIPIPRHIITRFHELDHKLIDSRTTPKNKAAKLAEQEKFNSLTRELSDHVDRHVPPMAPKWSHEGTEGIVIHPEEGSEVPRYKITSGSFRKEKERGPVKWDKNEEPS